MNLLDYIECDAEGPLQLVDRLPYKVVDLLDAIPQSSQSLLSSLVPNYAFLACPILIVIRTPEQTRLIAEDKRDGANDWHKDYDGDDIRIMAVWSDIVSTEIRLLKHLAPEPPIPPKHVILIDNTKCVHRTPQNYLGDRWFWRIAFQRPFSRRKAKEILP